MNAKEIKQSASLVGLLAALGYQPAKKTGREQLYLSPLRDSDTIPSFSVNEELGCWYDHGSGKGGNIIDFALKYWPGMAFPEVLEKIAVTMQATNFVEPKRKRSAVKEPHYQIGEIKPLGTNPVIQRYLESRGVWAAAQDILKEVYYSVQEKNFYAAGWPNELGAWEVRNARFKGCIGHKAISFIPGNPTQVCVFEGFINYLSWKTSEPFSGDSILVLNSLALIQSGISKAKGFTGIATYFDNDSSGRAATAAFKAALPQSIDHSWIYEGYNDYNDKIFAEIASQHYER